MRVRFLNAARPFQYRRPDARQAVAPGADGGLPGQAEQGPGQLLLLPAGLAQVEGLRQGPQLGSGEQVQHLGEFSQLGL